MNAPSAARPVILTVVAAGLAFIPLTESLFWGTMAYTSIGGTIVGTVLTLLFLLALCSIWFRVETPVLAKFGLGPRKMSKKPMKVKQCVSEGLVALRENRSLIIPGRVNRIMNAVIPASVVRGMMSKRIEKTLATRKAAVRK